MLRRWTILLCGVGLTLAVVVAAGTIAWHYRQHQRTFYTDGSSIRQSAMSVQPRQILWRPPARIEGELATDADESDPFLSADGTTLYFVRKEKNGNADIFYAMKEESGGGSGGGGSAGRWSDPQPLSMINTVADETDPCVSRDGQALYFASNRDGGAGGYDIWVSRRGDLGWLPPQNLGEAVNSSLDERGPTLSPDGSSLCFSSNRPRRFDAQVVQPSASLKSNDGAAPLPTDDLYVAGIDDDAVAQPAEPISEVNSPQNELSPEFSPAGDFLYFCSDRPGGLGGTDLYRSRRTASGFEPPHNLGVEVNTPADECAASIASNGFALLFASNRAADSEPHAKPGDFNLYSSVAREVYDYVDTDLASDWVWLWGILRPLVIWLLVGALAIAAFIKLWGGVRSRRLSLLTRCALASLAMHLLLLIFLTFWEVTSSISGILQQGGPTRVTIITSAGDAIGDLRDQVRSGLTEIALEGDSPASIRSAAELPVESPDAAVHLITARTIAARDDQSLAEAKPQVSPLQQPAVPADALALAPTRTIDSTQIEAPPSPRQSDAVEVLASKPESAVPDAQRNRSDDAVPVIEVPAQEHFASLPPPRSGEEPVPNATLVAQQSLPERASPNQPPAPSTSPPEQADAAATAVAARLTVPNPVAHRSDESKSSVPVQSTQVTRVELASKPDADAQQVQVAPTTAAAPKDSSSLAQAHSAAQTTARAPLPANQPVANATVDPNAVAVPSAQIARASIAEQNVTVAAAASDARKFNQAVESAPAAATPIALAPAASKSQSESSMMTSESSAAQRESNVSNASPTTSSAQVASLPAPSVSLPAGQSPQSSPQGETNIAVSAAASTSGTPHAAPLPGATVRNAESVQMGPAAAENPVGGAAAATSTLAAVKQETLTAPSPQHSLAVGDALQHPRAQPPAKSLDAVVALPGSGGAGQSGNHANTPLEPDASLPSESTALVRAGTPSAVKAASSSVQFAPESSSAKTAETSLSAIAPSATQSKSRDAADLRATPSITPSSTTLAANLALPAGDSQLARAAATQPESADTLIAESTLPLRSDHGRPSSIAAAHMAAASVNMSPTSTAAADASSSLSEFDSNTLRDSHASSKLNAPSAQNQPAIPLIALAANINLPSAAGSTRITHAADSSVQAVATATSPRAASPSNQNNNRDSASIHLAPAASTATTAASTLAPGEPRAVSESNPEWGGTKLVTSSAIASNNSAGTAPDSFALRLPSDQLPPPAPPGTVTSNSPSTAPPIHGDSTLPRAEILRAQTSNNPSHLVQIAPQPAVSAVEQAFQATASSTTNTSTPGHFAPAHRPSSADSSHAMASIAHPLARDVRIPTETGPAADQYSQRSPEHRQEVVEQMGGSAETERAVVAALRWFAAHQSADGRWAARDFDDKCGKCDGKAKFDHDVATTALAVMCFLAADHTHTKDGPYRETVQRAVTWLCSQQKAGGDWRGDETMYSHGIALIAVAEAYGMTKDPALVQPVKDALQFLWEARNRTMGGWRYEPGQVGDTSVLGWQVMAVTSAKRAGFAIQPETFDIAKQWLDITSTASRPGLYGYQPGQRFTPSMTAEGMFIQQLSGRDRNEARMLASAEFLMGNLPNWGGEQNTYYWYYGTLALFQHQGEQWRRWNTALTKELLGKQRTHGAEAGSWDPTDNWAKIGGRVYQTALCTLCLEVYYRYLPMYAAVEERH